MILEIYLEDAEADRIVNGIIMSTLQKYRLLTRLKIRGNNSVVPSELETVKKENADLKDQIQMLRNDVQRRANEAASGCINRHPQW